MSARHLPVRLVLGSVLAAGSLLLAACSGSSGSAFGSGSSTPSASSPTSGSPSSSAASSTPASSAPASSPPATASASAAATSSGPAGGTTVTQCRESQLRASIDPRHVPGSTDSTSARTGDDAIIVDFQNTSSRACTIYGYPGAALVNSSGKQVKEATRTIRGKLLGLPVGQNTLPRVTLQPGAYASAGIEGVNQQEQGAAQAGCDDTYYPRILVTPPNTRTAVPFDVKWPVCYSFTVHPTNIEKNPPS